ncbi:TniQ family protein [Actinoplanes xinjiangensis]|uniref:TniQ family protein n=1 Tax=Actinoplanes xinjiangensis TaxID=512350 RepID=UPI00342A2AEA
MWPRADGDWKCDLRRLPVQVRPLPGELVFSYLHRLGRANRTGTSLLLDHLGKGAPWMIDKHIHSYDLELNEHAFFRLSLLSGYYEDPLRRVLHVRRTRKGWPPAYAWHRFTHTENDLVRPCSHCAARYDIQALAMVKRASLLPVCLRHGRTLVPRTEPRAVDQSLHPTPEILTAWRRFTILRRRRRDTVTTAFEAASTITSDWTRSKSGRTDHIAERWRARAVLLPTVASDVIRSPETIALTTLFARHPELLRVPRMPSRGPTPMVFLAHAARYLDHPEPRRLLDQGSPLLRWTQGTDMPAWWWPNAHEPDRSIYSALKSNTIPVLHRSWAPRLGN